jgi:GWxTD domain-containing protein
LLTSAIDTTNTKYSFEKAGFFFEPLSFNLLNTDQNKLIFYSELYNTSALSTDVFFVKYFIESQDQNDFNKLSHIGYKKLYPSKKEALLVELDVTQLGTGNYKLILELNSKDKQVLKSIESRFSVYHPIIDIKSNVEKDALFETSFVQFMREEDLDYALKAIQPKVGNNISEALNYVIANNDIASKRYFLYNFWTQISKTDMKAHYDKYMEVVRAVDREFSNNVGYGFETDRGHYFLKYGRPSDIVVVEDEPSAPPYEIWIYNYMPSTQQTNVKFLFYNPSLVSNDFILLHSTCRGERSNPRWEVDLYSDALNENNQSYLDARSMPDNWNRNAKRYFTDF